MELKGGGGSGNVLHFWVLGRNRTVKVEFDLGFRDFNQYCTDSVSSPIKCAVPLYLK